MSTPTDARNLQTRIADRIRAEIETGQLGPGEQLPTIEHLAEVYKCSTAPVRAAVEMLKQQGLVVSRQGRGSFVRERGYIRRIGIERYSRSRWLSAGTPILTAEAEAQGLPASQLLREIAEVPAPSEVAKRLEVKLGTPVLVRKRTTMIGGRPNQLADSYYDLGLVNEAPRLRDEDTGPGGGFARIEESGHHLAEIQEEKTVRMPTTPESVTLELPAGTPVVDLVRTTFDDMGKPVEVMLAVIAGDMVAFVDRFPIPE